jgi:methylated-DNA-[protein]-cysteine S-methyltransferase
MRASAAATKALAGRTVPSPVGPLQLVARDDALVAVLWTPDRPGRVHLGAIRETKAHPVLDATATQLDEYFTGSRRRFDLPLALDGTPFQRAVWQALALIPFGETRSYRSLSHAIGRPRALRAVGAANGRNPISIIVPCHRLVGASGALTGFAGGVASKAWLLRHEGARDADP